MQTDEQLPDDRWSFVEPIRERAFSPLTDGLGFQLQRVTRAEYWQLHEAELRQHFPPEVFFNTYALRTEAEAAGQARMDEVRGDTPLRDFTIVRDSDALVGVFAGHQYENGAYRMYHTNVHPDFRGRGVYTAILRSTIDYTKALGFDAIVSEHAPGNNPVIIAKLKVGFRIVSMDIDPMAGTSIKLRYFHNPDHLATYHYRCGLATINHRLLASGSGAMPRLLKQFRAPPPEGDTGDDSPQR